MHIDLNDWQAETLRFTGFYAEPVDAASERLWERVVRREPDSIQQIKSPRPMVLEQGSYETGRSLRSTVQQDRFDLHLASEPTEEPRTAFLLGPYKETLTAFQSTVSEWLDSGDCPPVTRLAYGAVLLVEVDDLAAGYRLLGELLALRVEGALDLEYKINRRRTSAVVPGLEVNRLSAWSTITAALALVELPADNQGSPTMSTQSSQDMCRLLLDVNTVASNAQPLDDLGALFGELVAMGSEIVERGDIP